MSKFITDKNRMALWHSMTRMRSDLFSDTVNDSVTLARLQEVKISLDFAIDYLKAAKLYNEFENSKGKAPFEALSKQS